MRKAQQFLTFLAVKRKLAANSQNQAMNSVLFMFRHITKKEMGDIRGAVRAKSRPYQVEVKEEGITIPLRDFGDSKEIEKRQEKSRMMIWVQPEGAKPDETVVVKIPADQLPTVLQATVKSRRGQRKSKGFSRNEIISAGITMGAVERLHIPYDRRRKTSHSWNIEKFKTSNER